MKEFSIETKKAELDEKMCMLDIIADCYKDVFDRMQARTMECKSRTTDKQRERYNKLTSEYEPVFDENGNPVFETEWYFEDYTPDYWNYEKCQRDKALFEKILKAIEKLVD